jgi:Uma2 family endonuclease
MSTVLDATPEVQLPDHYDVVNGAIVELPPMSIFASEVANRLNTRLVVYLESNPIGRSRMDMQFRYSLPEDAARAREPDLAFISYKRWPEDRPLPFHGNPIDVVPDLAVEVTSPNNEAEELLAKVFEYLRAGARLVWLVYPRFRQIYAYTSVSGAPRVYTETDALDGGDVLPGFSTPMARLFPPVAEAKPG